MAEWIEILVSALLIIGGIFVLIGSIGLVKLPDFFTRLHAPTKATTLGIGSVLLASMVVHTLHEGSVSIHELVISLFLFITAPISAHMLAKAALHRQVEHLQGSDARDHRERAERQLPGDAPLENDAEASN
ncbi:Na+/H+ antiporter subunit G [Bacterioplanes sanyensis]|uniref:Na+/H+ antiporter subunit G n=1 Tax=Bacterioplanes sanyensis TaxID=1249553 RepID=A0A222FG31_9GAMM|nr:Na+/H+ antiporter subunit G [Bacterioplanes sanyensis]ASP37454.1 Na+/H+ antiporter subunit G [Bacterioplanes sanyensis]